MALSLGPLGRQVLRLAVAAGPLHVQQRPQTTLLLRQEISKKETRQRSQIRFAKIYFTGKLGEESGNLMEYAGNFLDDS